MTDWIPAATSRHQDHVIAHVEGATVLGYFAFDETAYLLLDIGFIWNIYLDGAMGLLPHPVAIAELEVDETTKSELRADVDALLANDGHSTLNRMNLMPAASPISSVGFWARENSRRLVLTCDEASLVIETSLDNGEVKIMDAE